MVGAERRSVEAERPTDMGPSQVHLARCAESLGEEQVLLDREPLSLQRPPAGVRQGRGGEGETTADVGTEQADLAVGAEPISAHHAVTDGEPVRI